MADLNKPQYNSTLKLTQKLNQIRNEKIKVDLSPEELERIHEKVNLTVILELMVCYFDMSEGINQVEPTRPDI